MKTKSSLLIVAILMASLPASYAATRTWSGGGGDNNWNTAGNWNALPAPPSDSLTFTGTTQTTTNNNFAADSIFTGITFDNTSTGGSFTLGGNRITLGGNIGTNGTTGTPTQTVALDMILNGNRTFSAVPSNALTVSGNISETGGSRGLTVSPGTTAAIITLTGNNTFTGSVALTAGTLKVNTLANGGNSSSLGAGTGSIKLSTGGNAGTLEYIGTLAGGHTTDRAIELGGTSAAGGGRINASGVGPVVFNAAAVIFSGGTAAKTLTFGGTNTAANTFASTIGNEGAFATKVAKVDAGTWVLSGANTFSGGVTLSAGQLNINNAGSGGTSSAIGTGTFVLNADGVKLDNTSGGALTLSTANTFNLYKNFTFVGSNNLSFANGSTNIDISHTITMDGTNSVLTLGSLTNTYAGNPTITVNNGAGSGNRLVLVGLNLSNSATARTITIAGSSTVEISGTVADGGTAVGGNLAYSGSGVLILSGTNANTGTISSTGSGGTVQIAKNVSLYGGNETKWTAANIKISSGATLALNVGGAGEFSTGNVTTLLGNLGGLGGAISSNGLQAGSMVAFDTTNAGGNFTVADNIKNSTGTGGGAIGVTKLGTGILTLSGNSTYTGVTKINAGTVALGSANAVGTTGNITFGGGALQFGANNTTDYSSRIKNSGSAVAIDTNGQSVSLAAIESTNTGGLTKSGAGTLTLTGTQAYTGNTTVSTGTLLINGSTSSSSAVSVSSGAILGGNGTVGGASIVLSGGTLSPGNSPGNLTFNSGLTLAGAYKWELGALSTSNPGTDFDVITVTAGNVDITGASMNLTLGGFAPTNIAFWQSNKTWAGILNNTGAGTLTGSFALIDNTSWASLGAFTNTYTGNDVNLVWTAVPEPATWAMLAFSLTTVMVLRRRRQS
jgi:fibronectin-binding autotransporter adhesin